MIRTAAHFMPFAALGGGILMLMPRLLNYVVAIYLILVGAIGLSSIYHFTADGRAPAASPMARPACRSAIAPSAAETTGLERSRLADSMALIRRKDKRWTPFRNLRVTFS
jgi:hypothetical protein